VAQIPNSVLRRTIEFMVKILTPLLVQVPYQSGKWLIHNCLS
jgi:hypothetical protein